MRARMLEPITQEERPEWEELITETKKVVNRSDKAQWELILLAGQVETKYGENRMAMWADEAGVSASTARQYAWLARKGVDEAFIKKYARTDRKPKGLPLSVIREVAGFAGSVTSRYAIQYLDWCVEHKATAVAVRAYMQETVAPQNARSTAAEEIKMELRTKQDHEGFSDYVRGALENIVQEHPEATEAIMRTVITDEDSLNELKIKAGIITNEEQKAVDRSRLIIRKLRDYRKWLLQNDEEIRQLIERGTEASGELNLYATLLRTAIDDIVEGVVVVPVNAEDYDAEDVILPSEQAS